LKPYRKVLTRQMAGHCAVPLDALHWLHLMLDTARSGMPVVTLIAAGDGRAMLVELSVMEQCYHAVMEVASGAA
jgi:hypothetical protein